MGMKVDFHQVRPVSILSPQQRGLQLRIKVLVLDVEEFQFSAPNKGDCNLSKDPICEYCLPVSILSPQQRGLQSTFEF